MISSFSSFIISSLFFRMNLLDELFICDRFPIGFACDRFPIYAFYYCWIICNLFFRVDWISFKLSIILSSVLGSLLNDRASIFFFRGVLGFYISTLAFTRL